MPWPIAVDAAGSPRSDDDDSPERATQLTAARDMLATALVILDAHARSQAAATVDLAIHLIDTEIGR